MTKDNPGGETSFPLAEGPTITPPLRGSCRPTREQFTPPLRGSHRGRAVCAKADVVGGETRFIAIPNYTPHRIACGLTPSALRLPLKGGVILSLASVPEISRIREWGLIQQPRRAGAWMIPAHTQKKRPRSGAAFSINPAGGCQTLPNRVLNWLGVTHYSLPTLRGLKLCRMGRYNLLPTM